MDLYGSLKPAIAGLKYGLDSETESIAAGEKFFPGDPVFGFVGDDKSGYGAHVSSVSLTANADLVTGNSVAVTINGVALDPIDFATSSAETIREIVNAINENEALDDLGIGAYLVDGAPRAFYLAAPGLTITASATVTGGASQAAFTAAVYTAMKFRGVAPFEQISSKDGVGYYPVHTSVPVQTHGKLWIRVAKSANPGDMKPAYVILDGEDAGKFTDVAGSNYDCGCFFRSGKVTNESDDLALIELRGLK
ncbi:MAG: hypothetical protein LBD78_05240 [Spirochaetaceae bacterium]|jgi:hypothetical protein|nr:hypothetical protein [Spirochaetaceae bacterium]